ncbi:MAG: hypothetical protein JSU07_09070 [Bacteroidetes bacterium]|nr:hypothetical protein [Bacteroidota bacterium]
MNKVLHTAIILILSFLISTCTKFVPATPGFTLTATNASVNAINNISSCQGSKSSKITDLFLYVNGQFRGVYPIGNPMPIVNNGQNVTINVFAGVKNSGMNDYRLAWQFYQYFTLDTIVPIGQFVNRSFAFNYSQGTIFEWLENFDNNCSGSPVSGYSVVKSPNSDSTYKIISNTSDCFEGKSLQFGLTGNATNTVAAQCRIESAITHTLPTNSANVFMELNYKCNQPFVVGILGSAGVEIAAITINPMASWNKIYIQLANALSAANGATSFKFYFKVITTPDNQFPNVFLDNIKVVHF